MNADKMNEKDPVEHILFRALKPGRYSYYVHYFGQHSYNNVDGGELSGYTLSLADANNNFIAYHKGEVS